MRNMRTVMIFLDDMYFQSAVMVPGTLILPIGLLISGWTARADIHWIAPDIVRSSARTRFMP